MDLQGQFSIGFAGLFAAVDAADVDVATAVDVAPEPSCCECLIRLGLPRAQSHVEFFVLGDGFDIVAGGAVAGCVAVVEIFIQQQANGRSAPGGVDVGFQPGIGIVGGIGRPQYGRSSNCCTNTVSPDPGLVDQPQQTILIAQAVFRRLHQFKGKFAGKTDRIRIAHGVGDAAGFRVGDEADGRRADRSCVVMST